MKRSSIKTKLCYIKLLNSVHIKHVINALVYIFLWKTLWCRFFIFLDNIKNFHEPAFERIKNNKANDFSESFKNYILFQIKNFYYLK